MLNLWNLERCWKHRMEFIAGFNRPYKYDGSWRASRIAYGKLTFRERLLQPIKSEWPQLLRVLYLIHLHCTPSSLAKQSYLLNSRRGAWVGTQLQYFNNRKGAHSTSWQIPTSLRYLNQLRTCSSHTVAPKVARVFSTLSSHTAENSLSIQCDTRCWQLPAEIKTFRHSQGIAGFGRPNKECLGSACGCLWTQQRSTKFHQNPAAKQSPQLVGGFNLFQPVSTCFNPPGPNTSKYVGQWGSPMIIIPGWMENKMPSQGTEGDMATDHPMRHRRKPGWAMGAEWPRNRSNEQNTLKHQSMWVLYFAIQKFSPWKSPHGAKMCKGLARDIPIFRKDAAAATGKTRKHRKCDQAATWIIIHIDGALLLSDSFPIWQWDGANTSRQCGHW